MCAVERIKEFSLDLGDLVKMRLDGFADSRQRIHAEQEAKFQRIVSEQGKVIYTILFLVYTRTTE